MPRARAASRRRQLSDAVSRAHSTPKRYGYSGWPPWCISTCDVGMVARRATPRSPAVSPRRRRRRSMTVTSSCSSSTRCSSSAGDAPDRLVATRRCRRRARAHPVAGRRPAPRRLVASRTAWVTSPDTIGLGGRRIASALAGGVGLGVVGHQRGEALAASTGSAPPARSWSVSASTCSATGMMFLLFGQHDHVRRRWPVDRVEQLRRRRVERLATGDDRPARRAARTARRCPSPLPTATTARRGPPAARRPRRGLRPSRGQLGLAQPRARSATSSNRSVTRILSGRPASRGRLRSPRRCRWCGRGSSRCRRRRPPRSSRRSRPTPA